MFLWDDPEEFERVVGNPIFKFQAATIGRLNQADWRKEGIEPVFPDDWHYAFKLLPRELTEAETRDVIARTPEGIVRKFCFQGTPREVAATLQGYVDAGANALSLWTTPRTSSAQRSSRTRSSVRSSSPRRSRRHQHQWAHSM